MNPLMIISASIGVLGLAASSASAALAAGSPKATTVVLVHGAFAESSSWNDVVTQLEKNGYPVIAAANPLRGLKSDADTVARIVASVHGPVVLVGHSYGGGVISMAATGAANVKALVFVAAFAPEPGESAVTLGDRFPTGTLGQTLAPPVPLGDGGEDLYIQQSKYREQFSPDVSAAAATQMAATQRPIAKAALTEPAGSVAWKSLPSWFIWGSADKNIPRDLHAFMAKRAGAKEAVEIKGASHVVMISHAKDVASMIERAAEQPN